MRFLSVELWNKFTPFPYRKKLRFLYLHNIVLYIHSCMCSTCSTVPRKSNRKLFCNLKGSKNFICYCFYNYFALLFVEHLWNMFHILWNYIGSKSCTSHGSSHSVCNFSTTHSDKTPFMRFPFVNARPLVSINLFDFR